MKITYISSASLEMQENAASVNRTRAFVKGLNKHNIEAKLFFVHTKKYRFKLIQKLNVFFRVFSYLIKAEKGEVIIFSGYNMLYIFIFIFRFKFKFIIERTEYPVGIRNPSHKESNLKKTFNKHAYNYFYKNIDAFITCSHKLKKYYQQFLHEKVPVFISPFIIDLEHFDNSGAKKRSDNYIGYCGSLNNNKDGVPILIKSFSKIANKYPYLNLHIAGKGDEKTESELRDLVDKLNLKTRVLFRGNISRDKMPGFLRNAELLALARPNNKQAEGGFPSKLGEYMAVKVPIVVTNVGELSLYLKDNYNCFMSEPDSALLFSEKLIEAIESEKIEFVISNAYSTVLKFSCFEQSKLLYEFLKTI